MQIDKRSREKFKDAMLAAQAEQLDDANTYVLVSWTSRRVKGRKSCTNRTRYLFQIIYSINTVRSLR